MPASLTSATGCSAASAEQPLAVRLAGVVVVADQPLLDPEVVEQLAGHPRVLAGDRRRTARSTSTARKVMSPRLPIGVATM